jgi:hypothetical protein
VSILAKELLVESACEEQRGKGKVPTPTDNEKYLVGIMERMDRRKADSPVPHRANNPTKKPGAFEKELDKRCRQAGFEMLPGSWRVDQSAPKPLALGGEQFHTGLMGVAEKRMRRRLRFLRSKPEWGDRIRSINPLALQGQLGHEKRIEAERYLRKILHAADVKFGEWWKPPSAGPQYFHGQKKRG